MHLVKLMYKYNSVKLMYIYKRSNFTYDPPHAGDLLSVIEPLLHKCHA